MSSTSLPLTTATVLHSTQPSPAPAPAPGDHARVAPAPRSASPHLHLFTLEYLPTCQPTIIPIHPSHTLATHAARRTPHAARTHLARGSFFTRSLAHSLAPTHGLPRPACMVCFLYAPARHADPCLRAVIGPNRGKVSILPLPLPYPT
jgi:hypothetical protein